MRRFKILVTLFIGWLLFTGVTHRAKACFEIIPLIHKVICYYDTINFQEMVIRISSLRTAANQPGTWCTCAIRNPSPALNLMRYIAVVDSGTNHRTDGFAPWYPWAAASSAWDSVYANSWAGFLGQIEGAGTAAGQPIELILRVQMNVGYALIPLMDDLPPSILGWADWDDSLQKVKPNRWWTDWPTGSNFVWVPIHNPTSFFYNFDNDLTYTAVDPYSSFAELELYPNPVQDILNLHIANPRISFRSVNIYDAAGRPVFTGLPSPDRRLAIDVRAIPAGIYFLRIQTEKGIITKKFVKARDE